MQNCGRNLGCLVYTLICLVRIPSKGYFVKKGARKLIVSLLKKNCEVTSKIVQGLIFVLRTQKRSPDQYKATSYFYCHPPTLYVMFSWGGSYFNYANPQQIRDLVD